MSALLLPPPQQQQEQHQRQQRIFSSSSNPNEWRKKQLENWTQKLEGKPPNEIKSEEELQPMWKEMEGRVVRRKPRTLKETGGRSGRTNIRMTDEDVWAQQGLYSTNSDNDDNDNNNNNNNNNNSSSRRRRSRSNNNKDGKEGSS
jgi:hypothetical protein